jgi:hypothetical protein
MAMPPTANSGNYADVAAIEIVPNVLIDYRDGFAVTAAVGSFPPNNLGIDDLGGNVAEWVNDRYSTAVSSTPLIDSVSPVQGNAHVVRGSGWRYANAGDLRLAARDFVDAGSMDLGLRLARYAPLVAASEADGECALVAELPAGPPSYRCGVYTSVLHDLIVYRGFRE